MVNVIELPFFAASAPPTLSLPFAFFSASIVSLALWVKAACSSCKAREREEPGEAPVVAKFGNDI